MLLCAFVLSKFHLGRVFEYKWTVNWKFLPESVFLGNPLAISLLVAHAMFLVGLAHVKWSRSTGGLLNTCRSLFLNPENRGSLSPGFVVWCVFSGNFLGIVFARSLHYQFYSWYFFSLPFLLWQTHYNIALKLVLFFSIEFCWNIFPATEFSSGTLLVSHFCLLIGLCKRESPSRPRTRQD